MTVTDPVEVVAQPLILTDAYFELTAVNLRCLVKHIEVVPENKLVTVDSFCGSVDYPGTTKWHLRVEFHQSFDAGAVYDTLQAALDAYETDGTPADFRARGYASRPVGPGNPSIDGSAIPVPFEILLGDAGAASEAKIDWSLVAPPAVSTTSGTYMGPSAGADD
jgi:hypothetical protein